MTTSTVIKNQGVAYPLSSAQTRFWFMEQLESHLSANNNPLDYRITGDLDIPLLEKSLQFLVRRHEALRTVFPNKTGIPSQVVLSDMDFSLRVRDLSEESPGAQETLVARYSEENAALKFDLENGPLFRFEILRLGVKDYILFITFHHIISDAGSIDVFMEELQAVYHSLNEGKNFSLPEIAYTLKDYAQTETAWLKSDDYRNKIAYWKQELSSAPEVISLPYDLPRPGKQEFRGDEIHFTVDRSLRERLAVLSRSRGAGMPALFLSAFGVLLNRYSMQDDFVVGMPFANRNQEELLRLFGVLINTLPVRMNFRQDEPFSDVLKRVQRKLLGAHENMDVPFERLIDELKVKRPAGMNPLFQVLFNYLQLNHREIQLPGIRMQLQDSVRKFSQVDMTLTVHDEGEHFHCIVQYNTDLFSRETMERIPGHLITILESVATNDQLDVCRIPVLTGDEQKKMLYDWNETGTAYAQDRCIHHMFEAQAAKTPDLVAVSDRSVSLTYRELNETSNHLAGMLIKLGIKEGMTVAVFLERSARLVATLLAVSKTGAAYLPLDPIFPAERLATIIQDANPVMIITEKSMEGRLPAVGTRILRIDGDLQVNGEPTGNTGAGNAAGTAYILYTSGSTGRPKGVPIRHHSVVNLVCAFSELLNISPEDTLLAVTTISFDIAQLELFLPLFNGAKLIIAPQEVAMDMQMLAKMMSDSRTTVFQATPVTYRMLLRAGWKGDRGMKVLVGGEALGKDLARDLTVLCGEVWNCYGPTETTIWSSVRRVNLHDVDGEGSVSIGRPLANNTFYVLNTGMQPVPCSVPGELYIGGDGVSEGYLNLPKLTSDKFVADIFSKIPGKKLYRTGDLVRYMPDGNLVFLNRTDSQVKVRGFRIELGEIETVLAQYPGIRENAVRVWTDDSGCNMLAGYYTLSEGSVTPDSRELRDFMRKKLPEYMIPSNFIEMKTMPLTSNNKIDRGALPKPETTAGNRSSEYIPPATPTEKELARLWESLLQVKKVGIDDDFFDAGGHSLIAVTMIRSIEKDFGITLPLGTIFEKNTIRHLAGQIDLLVEQSGSKDQAKSDSEPVSRRRNIFRRLFQKNHQHYKA